jgi:hypothetical protein
MPQDHITPAPAGKVAAQCPQCRPFVPRLFWQRFRNGTRHIRMECAACGGSVCFVKQTAETIAQADRDTTEATRLALTETVGDAK